MRIIIMYKRFFCVFFGVAIVATSVWAGQGGSPICNGKTPAVGKTAGCGEGRACNEPIRDMICLGTTVVTLPVTKECEKGSSNEYCVIELGKCTESWYCKFDPMKGKCVVDIERPLNDADGKQIVSMERIAVAKSCVRDPKAYTLPETAF
jgi:hypothetical protein